MQNLGNRPDALSGTSYRTLEVIGRGGMGRVVTAEHIALKNQVCVKLLAEELAGDPGLVDRFRIEAQALGALGGGVHPNLLRVQDFGVTPAGQPYLVMERLHGRTLQDERKARGAIPWREAVTYALDALAGVAVAHRAGIVHRDLKPANLFLCDAAAGSMSGGAPNGGGRKTVKVLDFGIAKILRPDGPVAPASVPTGIGYSMGTPRYAAPEQLGGAAAADARADVYGMGMVLYELCTGRMPFEEIKTVDELCLAQALDALPAMAEHAAVPIPSELQNIVTLATAKDREHRYADGDAMHAALSELLRLEPAGTPEPAPEPPSPSPRAPAANVGKRGTIPMPHADATKVDVPRGTVPLDVAPPSEDARTLAIAKPRAHVDDAADVRVHAPRRRATFLAVTIASTLAFAGLGWWLLSRWLG